ncbi:MAG: hypothetical protein GY814_15465 [Gammaproteobacteria bacterium]|nr:hypothetical protein [Gammaproteobacteria bacterium]
MNKLRRVSREKQRLLESAGEGIFSIQGKNIHNLIHHTNFSGVHCQPEACQILSSLSKGEGVVVDEDCF